MKFSFRNRFPPALFSAALLFTTCSAVAIEPPTRIDHQVSDHQIIEHQIEHQRILRRGWTIHVDRRLTEGPHRPLGERAIQLLTGKLLHVSLALPTKRLKQLREIPIYLDLDHPLKITQYHASKKWLVENGYDPAMEHSIQIPNAKNFVRLIESDKQPWVVMHELAHAFHDRILGFDNRRIARCFERLKNDKRLLSATHTSGKTMRHYGLEDHKEFFAEMTEAYLGRNDFYPFHRSQLREFDRETYETIRDLWSTAKSKPDTEN